jgi:D-glycero-alpha-D-manno-heptose-7-phosphate kinase
MIIVKTPLRISFFGGGSDFPKWYLKNSGEVISAGIDKYTYVSIRKLPTLFSYKYRLRYFNNEYTLSINEIQHPTIKAILKHMHNDKFGLDIAHSSDLPAQSGLGSSSAFTVGLIQGIYNLKKKHISKYDLAQKAIYIEQDVLKENIGSQDQFSTSFGGFNNIKFNKRKIIVEPMKISNQKLNVFLKSCVLFFTGFSRKAEEIEKDKIKKLDQNYRQYERICLITNEAKKIFYSSVNSDKMIDELSKLLNESWIVKKNLSEKVSNAPIDELFKIAMQNGASAGKLLGAGAGGFILFLTKNSKNKKKLIEKLKKLQIVEFKLDTLGSNVIYSK